MNKYSLFDAIFGHDRVITASAMVTSLHLLYICDI